MILFRIKLAVFAAIAAWRQAPEAIEQVRDSRDKGWGWHVADFGPGVVDLYGPCEEQLVKTKKESH